MAMTPKEVLTKHIRTTKYDNPFLEEKGLHCGRCFMSWGEDGCDAVQMARLAIKLREMMMRAHVIFGATPKELDLLDAMR